jgi:hypothetical protein
MFDIYLPSFSDELAGIVRTKLAFVTKTPTMRAKIQAEKHFENPDPNWNTFEKNLKKKTFQKVVEKDPRADDKLKRYVENYGGFLTSKQVSSKVVSKDSGQPYTIKELPGGRLACSCKNWQYRRSVDGGDCKHITALVEGKMKTKTSLAHMVKKALRTGLLHDAVNSAVTTSWNVRRNSRQALLGQAGGEIARRAQEADYERRNRRR